MAEKKEVRTLKYDQGEIALLIIEGICDAERPSGMTVRQALDEMDADTRRRALAASHAVVQYIIKQTMNAIPEATMETFKIPSGDLH